MARKREFASTWATNPTERAGGAVVAHSDVRPDNEYAALMEAMPGHAIETSRDELLPLRDILQDAIEKLTPREQWIFDALTSRRLSVRQLGRELNLSKSQVHREGDAIKMKLRTALIEHEEVRTYLR